jgi:hypothetical protein
VFRNKHEKTTRTAQPQDTEAKAEVERLVALPVADLAAELLPAFAPDAEFPTRLSSGRNFRTAPEAREWLMQAYGNGRTYIQQLRDGMTYLEDLERPVLEALQALEHACLITQEVRALAHGMYVTGMSITRLGESALADGNVLRYLDRL